MNLQLEEVTRADEWTKCLSIQSLDDAQYIEKQPKRVKNLSFAPKIYYNKLPGGQ